ncbi:50S ribosomal protein L24 [Blattabacterium cuenoti]|uniref:50S ribosomal protein L24 n=1 Tax=Blattabacterium cuenoti TaxID=1653831 RepID=UPI00163C5343|nr:50S ribosomal protein L24 [Blattabacterium cuenoti]
MNKNKSIKTGDKVIILSGNYKKSHGIVSKIIKKKNKIIIQGINLVKKHIKPNSKNTKGGIIEIEAAIHISNVKKVFNSKNEISNSIKKII